MRYPLRSFAIAALALGGSLLVATSPALAKPKKASPPPPEWFQYVVSFTCGNNGGDSNRVPPGVYATAVNLYNAGNADVTLRKSLALTFPPEEQAAGELSEVIEDLLVPGRALQIDCGEVRDEFVFPDPVPFTGYLQGFMVIESNRALHVEAIYTGQGVSGNVSIDVERIAERRVIPRVFARPVKVAVCHYPPGNPDNRHTIVIDAAALPAHQAHGDTVGSCNGNDDDDDDDDE
jgi:hypothetical protein